MASPLFSSQFIDFSHDLSCVEGGSRESSGTLTENSVCTPLVMNSEQFSDDLDDLDIFSVLLDNETNTYGNTDQSNMNTPESAPEISPENVNVGTKRSRDTEFSLISEARYTYEDQRNSVSQTTPYSNPIRTQCGVQLPLQTETPSSLQAFSFMPQYGQTTNVTDCRFVVNSPLQNNIQTVVTYSQAQPILGTSRAKQKIDNPNKRAKHEERLMRNRASANKSREKKRAEQHQLSEKIDSLTNQVTEMQSRIVHLEAENRMYKEQVSFLKSLLHGEYSHSSSSPQGSGNKASHTRITGMEAGTGTMAFAFVLCFALVFDPIWVTSEQESTRAGRVLMMNEDGVLGIGLSKHSQASIDPSLNTISEFPNQDISGKFEPHKPKDSLQNGEIKDSVSWTVRFLLELKLISFLGWHFFSVWQGMTRMAAFFVLTLGILLTLGYGLTCVWKYIFKCGQNNQNSLSTVFGRILALCHRKQAKQAGSDNKTTHSQGNGQDTDSQKTAYSSLASHQIFSAVSWQSLLKWTRKITKKMSVSAEQYTTLPTLRSNLSSTSKTA